MPRHAAPFQERQQQVVLLEQAVESVVAMVKELRNGPQVERIVWAWIFTLPVCALLGYLTGRLCHALDYH